jgi:hypothetical protein
MRFPAGGPRRQRATNAHPTGYPAALAPGADTERY